MAIGSVVFTAIVSIAVAAKKGRIPALRAASHLWQAGTPRRMALLEEGSPTREASTAADGIILHLEPSPARAADRLQAE